MMGRGGGQRHGHEAGFTLTEIVVALGIATILIGMLAPMVYKFMQKDRAATTLTQLQALYTGIVGDPKSGSFGYLGDVGTYPASLLDLVQLPASNPPGWNGPYVSNVQVNSQGIIIDSFGGTIEYFTATPVGSLFDQIALVSKGPDLSSTNTASNPNNNATFAGTLPRDPSYGSQAANADNIVWPNFISSSALLSRASTGTLTYSIQNYDANPTIAALVPACPSLYTLTLTSVPRGSNDVTSLEYQPGVTADFVQGLYDVWITSEIAKDPVWQERVAILPGTTLVKYVNLMGLDSAATPTFSLYIVNQLSNVDLDVYSFAALLGTVNHLQAKTFVGVSACAQITVKNHQNHYLMDEFAMPLQNVNKLYNGANFFRLCVTNSGALSTQVKVFNQGLLLGTVNALGKPGCWNYIQAGATVSITDKKNNVLQTYTMPSSNYDVTI